MTGKDINDLSIFGDYKQLENRVTTALLHILNVGGEELIRFIMNRLNRDLPSSKISISAQDKQGRSVPDGTLECSFKFKIFIESKIQLNAINSVQMERHKELVEGIKENILLYITPDIKKPDILENLIVWANWGGILKWISEYIENNDINEGDLLFYLHDNFETLLVNNILITLEWNSEKNDRVVVFAGGIYGEPVAIKYKMYFCPKTRNIKPSGYVSFYRNWRIEYCFKINDPPETAKLLEIPQILEYFKEKGILDKAKQKPEEFSWIYEPVKLFRLGERVEINKIENDKKNEYGIPIPFLYGNQRYTTIEKLRGATKTSHLL
ncbi:hypothetical protein LCGC14_0708820 [marine sediment metagenome]|uniref:Uncharacterized protein n=1 Tax=marine sediment metagenome TaxID=412755 RepID=A0A0F9QFP5_9ZZZZ